MREQGGGTLLSQVLERPKLSVKVPASTESNESKRRLSNEGGIYSSYVGAGHKSMLGGSILPPAGTQASLQQARFKGGSAAALSLFQGHRDSYNNAELRNLSTVERLKELRARLEPLLKPRAAPLASSAPVLAPLPPHQEETISPPLPQWGPGKRARRSRCDAFKVHGSTFSAKTIPPRTANEAVSPIRIHGWCNSTPAFLESDGPSGKGQHGLARKNGIISRVAANGCTSSRQGITGVERSMVSVVSTHKAEQNISLRQRINSTAEVPIINNGSNGHSVGGGSTHVSRVTAASETAAALASLDAKPRSELQALEWPRILIGLSRKEKEDDFLILKGTKLPQRPKKRPKVVERALHFCTPGNSLCDMSRGRYDVREKKSVKKRPRGLKAMESMESDSE